MILCVILLIVTCYNNNYDAQADYLIDKKICCWINNYVNRYKLRDSYDTDIFLRNDHIFYSFTEGIHKKESLINLIPEVNNEILFLNKYNREENVKVCWKAYFFDSHKNILDENYQYRILAAIKLNMNKFYEYNLLGAKYKK